MVVWVGHIMARRWFQIFFIFNPTWGKISNLTGIFQRGWNHQPDDPWEVSLLNDPLLYGMWKTICQMTEAQTLLRLPMPMGGCAPVPCDPYRKFGTDVETTRSSGVDAKSGNCSVILLETLCNSLGNRFRFKFQMTTGWWFHHIFVNFHTDPWGNDLIWWDVDRCFCLPERFVNWSYLLFRYKRGKFAYLALRIMKSQKWWGLEIHQNPAQKESVKPPFLLEGPTLRRIVEFGEVFFPFCWLEA